MDNTYPQPREPDLAVACRTILLEALNYASMENISLATRCSISALRSIKSGSCDKYSVLARFYATCTSHRHGHYTGADMLPDLMTRFSMLGKQPARFKTAFTPIALTHGSIEDRLGIPQNVIELGDGTSG